MENPTPFNVLVEKIERYCVDKTFAFKDEVPDVVDLFDITISSQLKKSKCVLHPSLNAYIYHSVFTIGSVIKVDNYTSKDEDNIETIRIIKEVSVLEYQYEKSDILSTDHTFFHGNSKKNLPILSSRGYYLALWNNDDCYGDVWKKSKKTLSTFKLASFPKYIKLKDLERNLSSAPPVFGTIITKSKLTHYGKKESNNKYPFVFSIEIESEGFSCSVTFWNKTCFFYFHTLHVGHVIVLRNYRVKRRYSTPTNTIYNITTNLNYELSINETRPKGDVDFLDIEPSFIDYRFRWIEKFATSNYPADTILDVVGIVTFIGRWERECKKEIFCEPSSCNDFYMHRWIKLKVSSLQDPVLIKLYCCSQNEILDNLQLGNVFVATRILGKINVICLREKFERFYHFTTTRETQLYKFDKNWTIDCVRNLPFSKNESFLEVLKILKDESQMTSLEKNCSKGGYFVYPPLPYLLDHFKALCYPDSEVNILSVSEVKKRMESMHLYQRLRLQLHGGFIAFEYICETDFQNNEIVHNPIRLILNKTILKWAIESNIYHENFIRKADVLDFLGETNTEEEYIRAMVVSDDEKNLLFVNLTPLYSVEFVSDNPNVCNNLKDKYIFILDIYYKGNDNYEVVANRIYQTK